MKYTIFKYINFLNQKIFCIRQDKTMSFVPFDPANTDYANFKREILADEAQLQDADGNLMTPEDAKEFVRTLP